MARIKGGLNAKKKHNRACTYKRIRRKKAEEASVQTALDRSYQCRRSSERSFLQQIYVWPEAGWRRAEQKGSG